MARDDIPTDANPFDEPLPFLESRTGGQQRLDELPDDWFDFNLQQIDTTDGETENAETDDMPEPGDSKEEQTIVAQEPAEQTDGYIEQREHAKTKRTVVGVVVALLVVAGLVFGFVSGAFANLLKSEPEQRPVASSESAPSVVEINVEAEGYNEQASPIVYHLVGGPSGDSAAHVDRYGVVPASSNSGNSRNSGNAGNSGNASANAFKVTFDDLPEGYYTVSWSTSFLPDGSILRASDETMFKVSRGGVVLTVEFARGDATRTSADEVRGAYEQLVEWLSVATGDAANMRDAILETARRNAEAAPAVVAAGGLDGNTREEESETNAGESQQQDPEQVVVTERVAEQAAEQGTEYDSGAETADNQNEAAGDDSGNAGNDADDNPGGNAEPEPTPVPTPEPTPAVEPEPAPTSEPSTNTDTNATS